MEVIDWRRVARPQEDDYDLRVLAAERLRRYGTVSRRFRVLDGRPNGDLQPARYDDPRISQTLDYLRSWPLAAVSVSGFVDEWAPMVDVNAGVGQGCSSGHEPMDSVKGQALIMSTVNDPAGGADGIVHEYAHVRLEALGILLEKHDGMLLRNGDEHLYFSPIRRDVPRPMTALLHGVYAWTWMVELELSRDGLSYLKVNVPKVRDGAATITRHAETTDAGRAFLSGFTDWAEDVTERAARALNGAGLAETPVPPREW